MATLERERKSTRKSDWQSPRPHAFSRDDYYTMASAGILDDQRVELIEGVIFEMAPIGAAHGTITVPLADLLKDAFGPGFNVRNQAAVNIGADVTPSVPQPDLAVVAGHWRDYVTRNPSPADIQLIVEIADSSLSFDRVTKGTLYATAQIPEYWIVNLVNQKLEVYRDPADGVYRSQKKLKIGDSVTPLLAPTGTIAILDFMP